jgi:hypothetical protein
MTTRIAHIKRYLAEAQADGENGTIILPWEWLEQLVAVVDAADAFQVIDHCPRNSGFSGACLNEAGVAREDWCTACNLAEALIALAWADDAFDDEPAEATA